MKVFVFREGKRYGPYSVEKLKEFLLQGNFTVEDLVCLDGETWQKISEVPGLTLEEKPVALESSVEEQPQVEPTPHLEAKPDEVLPEAVEEVQAVQEESSDSTEGSKNKRKILVWSGIGSFVTALAVGLFFFFSDNGGSSGEGSDGDYFTKPIEESNRFQKGATIVAALLGEVLVTDPSGVDGNSSGKRSAREGEVLLPGSLIETGSESEVILLFSNGHLTTLGSDTKMSVDAFVQEEFDGSEDKVGELKGEVSPSRMKLDLDFGEMIIDVKKLNKESSLVITTEVGVVGIRGTQFGVTSKDGSVAVSVLEGLVEFLDEKKVVHAVEQEKRLEAEKGEEPEIVALSNEDRKRMEAAISEAIRKTKDLTLADLAKCFDQAVMRGASLPDEDDPFMQLSNWDKIEVDWIKQAAMETEAAYDNKFVEKRRDKEGNEITEDSPNGYTGYAKAGYTLPGGGRMIFKVEDGWVTLLKAWQDNDDLWRQNNYSNGLMHGMQRDWHYNKKNQMMQEYKKFNGNWVGVHTSWNEDGTKNGETLFGAGLIGNSISRQYGSDGPYKGKIVEETISKDGNVTVSTKWYPNGQIKEKGNIKNGMNEGFWTKWYENGQKRYEATFAPKGVNAVSWKPNGEKCPDTNIVDGNGVWVTYKDDGSDDRRLTYKNGKIIKF